MRHLALMLFAFTVAASGSSLAQQRCDDVTDASTLFAKLHCTSTVAFRGTLGTFLLPVADQFPVTGTITVDESSSSMDPHLSIYRADKVNKGKPCPQGSVPVLDFDKYDITQYVYSTEEARGVDRRSICLGQNQDGEISFHVKLDSGSTKRLESAMDIYPSLLARWRETQKGQSKIVAVKLVMMGRNAVIPSRRLFPGWKANERLLFNAREMSYSGFVNCEDWSDPTCTERGGWECPCKKVRLGPPDGVVAKGKTVQVFGALVLNCGELGPPVCAGPFEVELHPVYSVVVK